MDRPPRKPARAKRRPGNEGLAADEEPSEVPTCGDFDMRIATDGTWFYRGSPIARLPLVKLFASVLRREGGEYWLVTPIERARVLVDDVPFTVVELVAIRDETGPALRFRTNIDEHVTADAEHPIRVVEDDQTGEPRPYVLVRPGLEARILRPVFYELAELAEERGAGGAAVADDRSDHRESQGEEWGVWSRGRFFPISHG